MKLRNVLLFMALLIITIGAVSAADVIDDTGSDNSISAVDDIETNVDTSSGDNPASYSNINENEYENAVITLSNDQTSTDTTVTFKNNVTLTSNDKKTLNNYKIVLNGNNITINNIKFNHQTSTDTKVIDIINNTKDVLINNTDITLTKSDATSTIGINIEDNSNNVIINNSNIDVKAVPQTLWHQDNNNNWYNQLMVTGINIDNSNNIEVTNTTIKLSNTTVDSVSGTNSAIVIKDQSNNVKIVNNTINATGATYNYGIMCADYINTLNITQNRVNVTGLQYNAGMDISTSVSSNITYNNITVNSTNKTEIPTGSEALSYGIILATYYSNNTNNNVNYNNINLTGNVAYAIENYLGTNNKINNNNITINAKRGLGIATNASNNNQYYYNTINITCNQDTINNIYETIQPQNTGILIINGSTNTISNNKINITETSTTKTTYAITMNNLSSSNTGYNNELYVYNTNGISRQSNHAINNMGSNNYVYALITNINSLNSIKKSLKQDINEDEIIFLNITDPSIESYTIRQNGIYKIYAPYLTDILLSRSVITIVDTYLPFVGYRISRVNLTFINTTFLYQTNSGSGSNITFINSSNVIDNIKTFTMDNSDVRPSYGIINYNTYFDESTNILLTSVPDNATIVIRNIPDATNNNPMIINKPINIISNNATWSGDITFLSGSEGSSINGLTIKGNLYINTSQITVKNNTINKQIILNEAIDNTITENNFTTEDTSIVLKSSFQNIITNNNITTAGDYTISIDSDSQDNIITGNELNANTLTGDKSVNADTTANTINTNTPQDEEPSEPVRELVITPTEFTTPTTTNIQATIYTDGQIDTTITTGKVIFKINGKTIRDNNGKIVYANIIEGVATLENHEISNMPENSTITAIYSGTQTISSLRNTTNITVKQIQPTITTENITINKDTTTITLQTNITIDDTPINTGKIIYKINGKTIKDTESNIIYTNVENGVATTQYTLPANLKTKTYKIIAIYTDSQYQRTQTNATLTINE